MLVQERARRATAGNRMRDLLEQALESDDLFVEAENDVEFEEREEEPDYVDSDFDGNSSEEGSGEDQEAEESLAREEKRQAKAARRPAVRSIAAVASALAPAPRRVVRRRPLGPRPSVTDLQGGVRSSSRRATVESKLATQSKLQEAEARRASAKARPVKRVKQLTQDMLIREALETEEGNTESLLHFLEREEERKARQRQSSKKEIQGPFVRWISVGLPQNIWVVRAHEQEARARQESSAPVQAVAMEPGTQRHDAGSQAASAQPHEETAQPRAEARSTEGPMHSHGTPDACAPEAPPMDEKPVKDPEAAVKDPEVAAQDSEAAAHAGQAGQAEAPPASAPPPTDSKATPATAPVSDAPAALAEPPFIDTPARDSEGPSAETPGLSDDPMVSGDTTARTILTLQNMEPTTTWVDEFRYLLGDHCAWDRLPIVPSRNRPFRPRQSLCVMTGLPARYRDPHTGLPYATTQAYAMLRRVLNGEFLWTGSPHRAIALAAGCFGSALTDEGAGRIFS
ncbi:hypothetical protein MEQU1_003723 [Malassezia equina]|uniref:Vps72/YL1 C-terminal domain-containing protein n=1 Tax=Malassezia equina TaxID=1381935 RepID=A0AAF0J0K5_9BASI|nr:hypothetical protein MEQU1_003723 [Malassezia equina]